MGDRAGDRMSRQQSRLIIDLLSAIWAQMAFHSIFKIPERILAPKKSNTPLKIRIQGEPEITKGIKRSITF